MDKLQTEQRAFIMLETGWKSLHLSQAMKVDMVQTNWEEQMMYTKSASKLEFMSCVRAVDEEWCSSIAQNVTI